MTWAAWLWYLYKYRSSPGRQEIEPKDPERDNMQDGSAQNQTWRTGARARGLRSFTSGEGSLAEEG